MRKTTWSVAAMGCVVAIAIAPSPLQAQTAGQGEPPKTQEARPTGLPPHIEWKFTFDAGWGSFGFANSYYNNPKGTEQENLSDQWFEGFVKPALTGSFKFASTSELYGKVSVVGERTYGNAPAFRSEEH